MVGVVSLIACLLLVGIGALIYVTFIKPLFQTTSQVARRYDQGTEHLRQRLAEEEEEMRKCREAAEEEYRQHIGGEPPSEK